MTIDNRNVFSLFVAGSDLVSSPSVHIDFDRFIAHRIEIDFQGFSISILAVVPKRIDYMIWDGVDFWRIVHTILWRAIEIWIIF